MKSLFTKLDTSEALDAALKDTKPRLEIPESLHGDIMRAVRFQHERPIRAGQNQTVGQGFGRLLRWIPVSALFVCLLLALWWALPRSENQAQVVQPSVPQPLAMASQALDFGSAIPFAMPGALTAPISDEMDRIRLDLTNAVDVMLASFP